MTDEYGDRMSAAESLDQLQIQEKQIISEIKRFETLIKTLYIPELEKAQKDVRMALNTLNRRKGK